MLNIATFVKLQTIMENEEQPERETKFCQQCNSFVETEVIYKYHLVKHSNEDLRGGGTVVRLSKCLRCKNPFLAEIEYEYYEDIYLENSVIQFYPNEDNPAIKNCPKIVIVPYQEALKCYRAQAYYACVVMCRKGIEAICTDKGENKGSLATKLSKMKENRILEGMFFDWTEELRLIGNDGAHSHEHTVTQQDANDALIFFEALITYLYHLVNEFNRLKDRRRAYNK